MFRFSIRDVLWLTVVVGLTLSLFQQRTQFSGMSAKLRRQESALRNLDFRNGRLLETIAKQRLELERHDAGSE